jgi:diaminopimelate decarboxylase
MSSAQHCQRMRDFYPASTDQRLRIAGMTITQISQLLPAGPFYVYSRAVIEQKIAQCRTYLPAQIKLHYAVKANPYVPLVHAMRHWVDGFDVASAGELLLALQTGMPTSEISFAGPAKTDAELRVAVRAGVQIHIESLLELERVETIGVSLGVRPQVLLRVNPDFSLKASGMQMAGGAKPFGIDLAQVLALLPDLAQRAIDFWGVHIYCGSQNLNASAIAQMHDLTFELITKLKALCPLPIRKVNIGGGFGVPYFAHESALDLPVVGAHLHQLCERYAAQLADTELVIELGRYLVAEAGVYACQIQDIKVSAGKTFWCCQGGLHHHLANSGNFGQVLRKNYPVAVADRYLQSEAENAVTVVGPLCTPLDIVAEQLPLPPAQVGDWIVVFQSGAYGASASPQAFLGHPAVHEILL